MSTKAIDFSVRIYRTRVQEFLRYWVVWATIGACSGVLLSRQSESVPLLALIISGVIICSFLCMVTYPFTTSPTTVGVGGLAGVVLVLSQSLFSFEASQEPQLWANAASGMYTGALGFAFWGVMKAPFQLYGWLFRVCRTQFTASMYRRQAA